MNRQPLSQGLVALLFVSILILGLSILPKRTSATSSQAQPQLTTQATNLTDSTRLELHAELSVREEQLTAFEQKLQEAKNQESIALAVSPETAKDILRKLDAIEAKLKVPETTYLDLVQMTEEIRGLWLERSHALHLFLDAVLHPNLPILPDFDSALVARLNGDPLAAAYKQRYLRLQEVSTRFETSRVEAYYADLSGRVDRLRRVVWLRYQILFKLSTIDRLSLFFSAHSWLSDCSIELRNYPGRQRSLYLLARSRLEHRYGEHQSFWLAFSRQWGLTLLSLFFTLSLFVHALQPKSKRESETRSAWAWLIVWLATQLSTFFIDQTVAGSLSPVFILLGIFSLYRAYLRLAEGPLLRAILASRIGQQLGVRRRAARDLRLLGFVFWLQATANALASAFAGPGLLLVTTEMGSHLLTCLLYWVLTWNWRAELGEMLQALTPGPPRIGKWLGKTCSSPFYGLILAPLTLPIVLVLATLFWLAQRTVNYDWAKQISAKVFIRWVEATDQQDPDLKPVPSPYRDTFLKHPISFETGWNTSAPRFTSKLEQTITKWSQEQKGNPLFVIHGLTASERRQVANHLEHLAASPYRCRRLDLADRVVSSEGLRTILGTLLGTPDSSEQALVKALSTQKLSIILIPNAEHLFKACPGGFDAISTLWKLAQSSHHKVLWCLILPTPSYRYLRLAMAERWGAPMTLRIPRWNEAALASATMERHRVAGGELHYAPSVQRAAEATPGLSTQTFYFHILGEVSKGNPAIADELWLEAAGIDNQQRVVLGLPPRKSSAILLELAPTAWYLLAAITRHGNLTWKEALQVTDIPVSLLQPAWERCQELGILSALKLPTSNLPPSPGLSIALSWITVVDHFLKERNLLDAE